MKPTSKQQKLLAQIWRYEQENQISPSYSEMRVMLGVKSFQSVIDMINRLEACGWVTKDATKARSISLTANAKEYLMAMGAAQVLNLKVEIDGYTTNKINSKNSDSTSVDHKRAVANTSITYNLKKESLVPQQLSLFNAGFDSIEYSATENSKSNISFNTVTLRWFSNLLDSTSTTASAYAKEFVGEFFSGPFVVFALFLLFGISSKLTNFSFQQIVFAVILCTFASGFKNYRKEKHVSSN